MSDKCTHCQGSGEVAKAQDIKPAAVPPEVEMMDCPNCKGTGHAAKA